MMERAQFVQLATAALEHIEEVLADLEHESLDVELAGDVLTLEFDDGPPFIINAHSAAGQVWMAADNQAWHFDYVPSRQQWVASKTDDELMETVSRKVTQRIGTDISL